MTPLLQSSLSFGSALVVATLLGLALRHVNRNRRCLAFADERRVHRWLLAAVIVAPILLPLLPSRAGEAWRLPSKVWIAPEDVPAETLPSRRNDPGAIHLTLTAPIADVWAPALLFLYLAVALGVFAKDVMALARFLERAQAARRFGRVTLLYESTVPDALSFRWGRRSYVALGPSAWASAVLRRTALCHEAEHLRSADTLFAWVTAVFRAAAWALPPVRLWLAAMAEVEEFACDEAVSSRGDGSAKAYARGLLEVAETRVPAAGGGRPRLAAALGACGGGPLLVRRVRMLLERPIPRRPRQSWLLGAACAALLVGAAAFGRGSVVDGRVSRVRAEAAAARLLASDDLAIPVNKEVLRELNRFVGTAEGRDMVRLALERMEPYRPMVEEKMREYGVPRALLALPLVESRWKNLPPRPPYYGAGLWMFIKSTARAYGLRVDAEFDERLDEPKETDAAMRLLVANRLRFRSWALSLIAYNGGEGATQKAINAVGRDPWKVVEYGAETDKGYLAKVFAAALIVADPELVP